MQHAAESQNRLLRRIVGGDARYMPDVTGAFATLPPTPERCQDSIEAPFSQGGIGWHNPIRLNQIAFPATTARLARQAVMAQS